MMHSSIGLPLPMARGGHMDGSYRFHHQGSVLLPGGPPGMPRPQMPMGFASRGPVPGGQMLIGRMPGPPMPGVHAQHSVVVMQQPQRPGVPPGPNNSHLIRQQIRPGAPGMCNQASSDVYSSFSILSLF
jgi:hypothetical protein